jgi:hypothetical protein
MADRGRPQRGSLQGQPALHLLLASAQTGSRTRRRTRAGADFRGTVSPGEVIGYLREHEITITWIPAAAALQARHRGC